MKTKRILAILLAVMLIAAAVPAASAAEVVTETDLDFSPGSYRYTLKVQYVLEGSNPKQVVESSTIKNNVKVTGTWNWRHMDWEWPAVSEIVTPTVPAGYELVDSTPETVNISYPGLFKKVKVTVTFYVREPAPEVYPYTINYVFYLGEGLQDVDYAPTTGSATVGTVIPIAGAITLNDVTYNRKAGEPEDLTVEAEGSNEITVQYYAESDDNGGDDNGGDDNGGDDNGGQTSEPPVYIPPQVIIPTTPTPEPEIELPEEEIPAEVPEIEEEEQFEDEEIPTDVPTTGDASPIFPAIALVALAGAAFALTFKKSRNNG